jgi:hypothetical protein
MLALDSREGERYVIGVAGSDLTSERRFLELYLCVSARDRQRPLVSAARMPSRRRRPKSKVLVRRSRFLRQNILPLAALIAGAVAMCVGFMQYDKLREEANNAPTTRERALLFANTETSRDASLV